LTAQSMPMSLNIPWAAVFALVLEWRLYATLITLTALLDAM